MLTAFAELAFPRSIAVATCFGPDRSGDQDEKTNDHGIHYSCLISHGGFLLLPTVARRMHPPVR